MLNDTLIVNGQHLTIVGVAPEGFDGTTLGAKPQVFVPITLRGLMNPGFNQFHNRRSYWAYLFARLRPGVTIEQARTQLNVPYHAIINDVEAPLQRGHERSDDGPVQGAAGAARARRARTEPRSTARPECRCSCSWR